MTVIFYVIVGFLLVLAVFDLFVGVSNDAVNFLNSSVGAKVASFRTILMVASAGVLLGALLSAGMMDVARHGVMHPSYFSFKEVMTIFLAVMITDVVVLDMFNNMGMPTSTTVSLVFELLGASFIMALLKTAGDSGLSLDLLLNGNRALTMIIAIFVSVAIAFVSGLLVQWLSRLFFSFNYKARLGKVVGIFGGIAFTTLAYFIFVKGIFVSPYLSESLRLWIEHNTTLLVVVTFLLSTLISQVLYLLKVNVFKIIILSGTFSLAMAFAGNDLVNFIGVSLAAVDSLKDFVLNGSGNPDSFMMTSLEESAQSPMIYLLIAGIIMIIALVTSKKARHVIKTEVSLSRQGEGAELFGSSPVARVIVRSCRGVSKVIDELMPASVRNWIASRFDKRQAIIAENAAFDELRASVNLILSALLIAMGTSLTLPLSTTYVTFMVAMGSSLADKAWNRETAVFRITGVLNVLGSWFLTAGIAFLGGAVVCLIMYYGGFPSMVGFMLLVGVILFFSKRSFDSKTEKEEISVEQRMLSTDDPQLAWQLLSQHFSQLQSQTVHSVLNEYSSICEGLENEDLKALRRSSRHIREMRDKQQGVRRLELAALRRSPSNIAAERNTWFHLAMNCDEGYLYEIKRMLDPIIEHVDNSFTSLPSAYIEEYKQIKDRLIPLLSSLSEVFRSGDYSDYESMRHSLRDIIAELVKLRKLHIERMRTEEGLNLKTSQLYLNLIQETAELADTTKHLLRACYLFSGK